MRRDWRARRKICRRTGRRANVWDVTRPVPGEWRGVERSAGPRRTAGWSWERSGDDGPTTCHIGRRPRPDSRCPRARAACARRCPAPRCRHGHRQPAPSVGARRRHVRPARVRAAGDPDAPAALAGRGDDRPGAGRHQRGHARPVRQHRRRRRPPRPGRAGRHRPRPRRLRRAAGLPHHRRGPPAARPGEVAVHRPGDARRRADPGRRPARSGLRRRRPRRAGPPRRDRRRRRGGAPGLAADRVARRAVDG